MSGPACCVLKYRSLKRHVFSSFVVREKEVYGFARGGYEFTFFFWWYYNTLLQVYVFRLQKTVMHLTITWLGFASLIALKRNISCVMLSKRIEKKKYSQRNSMSSSSQKSWPLFFFIILRFCSLYNVNKPSLHCRRLHRFPTQVSNLYLRVVMPRASSPTPTHTHYRSRPASPP